MPRPKTRKHLLIDLFDKVRAAGSGADGIGSRQNGRSTSPGLFDVLYPAPNPWVAALDAVVHEGIQPAVRLAFSMQVRTLTSGPSEGPAGRSGARAIGEHELSRM